MRRFRIRMRKGVAMASFASDGTEGSGATAAAGEEIVVPEQTAAFLVRRHAAEVIEAIDAEEKQVPGGPE
jgi:hypothetical protein